MIKRYLSLLLLLCLLVGTIPGYASAAGAPAKPYLESGWVNNSITVPIDAPDADSIHDVIYADGKFVTVGGMLGISYDNGLTYTANRPTNYVSYGITYGNGIFVAVGAYGEIKTSFDGENWMVINVADFPSVDLNSVTYGNEVYVAVGKGGKIMTSTDSFSWIDQRSGVTSNLNSVTYGNEKFMAVGENGTMLTSDDGLTWDIQASGTTNNINDVIFADGNFVSVGEKVAIVTSNVGESWSSDSKLLSSQYFISIMYYKNLYFAVSHSHIQVSSNLIDWTDYYIGNVGIHAIAASNDTIVLGTDDYVFRKVVPLLYAFTYDGNGNTKGTEPYRTEWYAEGDEIWIAGNDYKLGRDGYTTTTYWNTSADGNGLAYSSYYAFNDKIIMGKDNITLYAQYTKDGDAGKPAILTQPIGTTVTEGDASPTLSIDANRTDTGVGALIYQWYSNTTDSDIGSTLIEGARSSSYSVPTGTMGTTYYYVVVTNRLGDREPLKYASTPSFRVAVVVNAPVNAVTPVIGTEPTGAIVTVGDVSPTVSVVATKRDSGTLSYQWYSNTTDSEIDSTLIEGATSASYSAPTGAVGTTYYYVVVTNTNGAATGAKSATATSSVVAVVVNAPVPLVDAATPVIGSEPTGATVTVGDVSPTVSVVATTSDAGTLSYQWYSNTTSSNTGGTLITEGTSASYSVPTGTAGTTYYYVVVTNTNGAAIGAKTATATSSVVAVVVNAPVPLVDAATPVIGTEPTGATVTVGDASPAVSVEATKSDAGTLSYQWYSNTTSSTTGGTLITEATSATYSVPTGTAGTTYYYVVVTNTNGAATGAKSATATSSVVAVVVNAAPSVDAATPVIGTEPTGATVTVGDASPAVSVEATKSDAGTLSYQWYSNTTSSTTGGTLITEATNATYSVPTGTAGTTYYYVVVTNTNGAAIGAKTATATSSVVAVVVNAAPSVDAATPVIGTEPTGATVTVGDASPAVSVEATTSDAGTLSYQWYTNTTSSTTGGTLITEATNATYSVPTGTAGTTYYYVVVTNTNGAAIGAKTATATSSVVAVVVNASLAPTYNIAAIADPTLVGLTQGYGSGTQQTKTITITNTGTGDLTNLSVLLSGVHAAQFEITSSIDTLHSGDATSFTIKAKDSLATGTYSAIVTVSADHMANVMFTVKQVVNTRTVPVSPSPSPTPSSIDDSKVTSNNGEISLVAGSVGEVSLDKEVTIDIPAHATDKDLKLTINKVLDTQGLLTYKEILASQVFEILKNFPENFSKPVTLTFTFDPASLKSNHTVAVFYYDEVKKEWVKVEGGNINGNRISAVVNHFTKFAVLVVDKVTGMPVTEKTEEIVPEIGFSDIDGHWAAANIKLAVSSGIVKGYQNGTFMPNKIVTRAEFTVMLMNVMKPEGEAALTFTDATEIATWAKKAVAQAVQLGIINGYEDDTFRPNAAITRAEMASMIAKTLNLSIDENATTGFTDETSIPLWAKGVVAAMKKYGIMEGAGANNFISDAKATRAEAVTVLIRILEQKII